MAATALLGVAVLPNSHGVVAAVPPSPNYCRISVSSRPVRLPLRICAQPVEQDYVGYDGDKSVFPAEACEELGGDNCLVEGVGAEVKPTAQKPTATKPSLKGKDRQYLDYKEDKTVFPGEACDELGGEFCEPEFQKGVFQESK